MTDDPNDPIFLFDHRHDPDDFGRGRSRSILPLQTIVASSFASKTVPPRPWLVRDVVPEHTVTILSGDGGTGKSLLALQLGVAVATGGRWIGHEPQSGGVVYLSAEDDVDEVHRRLADIASAADLPLADLSDFHLVPLAGKDAVFAVADRGDVVTPTPLWSALAAKIRVLAPKLLIIDNLADVFAGNENSRPQARQFVGLLRGLAIDNQMSVLLIAHPSLTGLSSGTGTSGSTAWSNSVRSRLYLERAKTEDGIEPDPDLRVLRCLKANYSAVGAEWRLKWKRGHFGRDDDGCGRFDKLAAQSKAEATFVDLVRRFREQDRDVSSKVSNSYAPAVFAAHPNGQGISKKGFATAMNRLFEKGMIRNETFGPPSKPRTRIAVANTPSNGLPT